MLQLSSAGKRFGQKLLFEDANWLITPDERTGLVGGNGTGKSTLLKILAGVEQLDYGALTRVKGMTLGYLPQDGLALRGKTVFAECLSVFDHLHAMETESIELMTTMSEKDPKSKEYAAAAERYSDIADHLHVHDIYTLDSQVGAVLGGLGFSKEDWERKTEEFSGGWQMRIALAKLLLQKPSLLLLDEPTNHLDLESRNWLENYLHDYPNAFILISHDRYFLDVTVNKTVELWNKRMHTYHGNYEKYVTQKEERRTQLMNAYKNQKDRIEALEAFINRFRAQATKAKQVQSRIKELEKIERIEVPEEEATIHFSIPQPPSSGRTVIEVTDLKKVYPMPNGGEKLIFEGLNFTIERGDRIALVGANGAGKSTLIRLLSRQEEPTGGDDSRGAQRAHGLLRPGPVQGAGPGRRDAGRYLGRIAEGSGSGAAEPAGMLHVLGRRRLQEAGRALGRRTQPLRDGEDAGVALELPAAGRADQPPRPARQGRPAGGDPQLHRDGAVRLARPLLHRRAGDAGLRGGGQAAAHLSGQLRGLPVAQTGRP